ncbi:hypothetical protein WA026_005420 [Henosepilachna vigintioctopunctata]|uniref:Uncharacterized protein n=1 Tax=Henosepilachna vigintioctopunctata TaxID=420089 RepID=A0AAW1TSP9_9CUCU
MNSESFRKTVKEHQTAKYFARAICRGETYDRRNIRWKEEEGLGLMVMSCDKSPLHRAMILIIQVHILCSRDKTSQKNRVRTEEELKEQYSENKRHGDKSSS